MLMCGQHNAKLFILIGIKLTVCTDNTLRLTQDDMRMNANMKIKYATERCHSCVRKQKKVHTHTHTHTHTVAQTEPHVPLKHSALCASEWMKWLRGKSFGLILILHTLRRPYISFIHLISAAVSKLVRSILHSTV